MSMVIPEIKGYTECGQARVIAMKKAAKSLGSIPFLSKSVEQLQKEGYTYEPGHLYRHAFEYKGEPAELCKEDPGKWISPHYEPGLNFIKKLPISSSSTSYGSYSMENSKKNANQKNINNANEKKRIDTENKKRILEKRATERYKNQLAMCININSQDEDEDRVAMCKIFMDKHHEEDKVLGQSGGTRKKRRHRRPSKSLKKRRS